MLPLPMKNLFNFANSENDFINLDTYAKKNCLKLKVSIVRYFPVREREGERLIFFFIIIIIVIRRSLLRNNLYNKSQLSLFQIS